MELKKLDKYYEVLQKNDPQNHSKQSFSNSNNSGQKQIQNFRDEIIEDFQMNFERIKYGQQFNNIKSIVNKNKSHKSKFKFLYKKSVNRDVLQIKISFGIVNFLIYILLLIINLLYCVVIPYIYLYKELIPKLKYHINVNNHKPWKVYTIGFFDALLFISPQIHFLLLIYFYNIDKNASEQGIYRWALYNIAMIFIWCFYLIINFAIQEDIGKLKTSYEKNEVEIDSDLSNFEMLKLKFQSFQRVLKDFIDHLRSEEKQDHFENFLNMGYIIYLCLKPNFEKLKQVQENLKNKSKQEQINIRNKIFDEMDLQLAQEDDQIIVLNALDQIQKDIKYSAKQLQMMQSTNLDFSYYLDFDPYHYAIDDKSYFLEQKALEKCDKYNFRRFRDARKFIEFETLQLMNKQNQKQSIQDLIKKVLISFFTLMAFPLYVSFFIYPSQPQYFITSIFLTIVKCISLVYMITLIYKVSHPKYITLRVELLKLCKTLISFQSYQGFVHPQKKFLQVQKWDICSTLTMENWNVIRRLSMLMFYQECQKQETLIKLLVVYCGFIAIFFIGLSDNNFTYKIHWEYLTNPIIVSLMINHFIYLLIIIINRIDVNAQFNSQLDEQSEQVHKLMIFFRDMGCNAKFYFDYLPETLEDQSLAFAVASKLKLRIQQQDKSKGLDYDKEEYLQEFEEKCEELKKTFKLIWKQILADKQNYSILFANFTVANTSTQYTYLFGALILYSPFIYKAIVGCLQSIL